ncbi:MarR family winged helix-turn-helix transcriptional regulator [Nocardioides ferulae]|uniref:MarR family winged helix-turn-helix transcriptional regulator n=1 Tax=Nocardioides ferulae TaxID=2340821 RepID=UPI000EB57EBA|nr:MarR family transcriptional regulator [Nocardioides ferulae]
MPTSPVPRGSPTMRALRAVVETGARARQAVARRAGLGESEMRLLDRLGPGAAPGPAELARALELTTPAVTGVVDRLAARGHVERRAHPADRRRVEVHLTDSGRAEVLGHLAPMLEAMRRLEDDFDEAELAVVERYLRGAVAAFEELAGDQPSQA